MRALGLILLLFGLATIVLYFTETRVEWLDWIGTWGENAAWGIRGGAVLVGLLLLSAGGKRNGPPRK